METKMDNIAKDKIIVEKKSRNILEDYDYEVKVRVLTLNKRIDWFIENKPYMSINEKWDAFYHICDDFEGYTEDRLMQMINNNIRRKGLAIDQREG
jgi:hypothetical protein